MNRITFKQYASFIAVAEAGGVAQAARAVNASTAAVAAHIDNLEAETGLTLFERLPAKGMTLTPEGAAFLPAARTVIGAGEEAAALAADLAGGAAGELRFGCFHGFAPIFAPPLHAGFAAAHPEVRLTLHEKTTDALLADLSRRRIDLALVYRPKTAPDGIGRETLVTARPRAILSARHPLAGRPAVSLAELKAYPHVEFRSSDGQRGFTDLLYRDGAPPRIALASLSHEVVRSVVGGGDAFALLAFQPANMNSYAGDPLAALPLTDPVPGFDIALLWDERAGASRLIPAFRRLCAETVRRIAPMRTDTRP